MARVDANGLATILREAAQAEIVPRFRRLDANMVRTKSEAIDLVTEADTRAEAFIFERLAALEPETLLVGEEASAAEPGLIDRLPQARRAIVVDPVDGTANFTAGLPLFAVMAAIVENGRTVGGVIYDPMGDDWFVAEPGSGAFVVRPDGHSRRLRVAEPAPLGTMIGNVSVGFLPRGERPRILANLDKVRLFANYRCSGHDYRLLASGFVHFAHFTKLMPWDHLAGALIAAEAGAHVRRLDGSEYRAGRLDGGLLVAPDEESWRMLREEVFTV